MRSAAGAKWRRTVGALALVAGVFGCGGDDYANDRGAAPEVTVGAVVTVKRVTVAPARLHAGIVELLASNQTARSQRVQLRSVRLARGGTPLAQSTGPINPGGVASLKAELAEGSYVVSAVRSDLEPATLVVEPEDRGDPDRLLQP